MAKIVVPVDFSDCSESNCEFSLDLATRLGAEIRLLHCFSELRNYQSVSYIDKSSIPHLIESPLQLSSENETKEALQNFIGNIKKLQNKLGFNDVKISQEIVYGTPADEILNFCHNEKPDLLLLSSNSSGDKVKKVLGSLSYHLLKSAKIPTLVIPAHVDLSLDQKVKIAFVSRFDENEVKSLNQLIRLVSVFDASLTILHVGNSDDEEKYLKQLARLQKQLASFYKKHRVDFKLIDNEDWIEGIKSFSTKNNYDIVSFTSKRRGFFSKFFNPSITKSLLFDYNKPLLVFQA